MNYIILTTLMIAHVGKFVNGLSSGAPLIACKDFIPLHRDTTPTTSYPPYQIVVTPGVGRIHLLLGSPQGLAFKGFILSGKDVETGEKVGEFLNIPNTVQSIQCTTGFNNTVTHKSSEQKQNIELDWIIPNDYEGTVIFNSTFLQDYATYWIGVESPRITVLKDSIKVMTTLSPPTTPRPTTTPQYQFDTGKTKSIIQHPIYEGCGITKNCFGAPDGCIDSMACNVVTSVEAQGENYFFELMGVKGKYIAVGLSKDDKMGDDSVVECVEENGKINIHTSWNSGKTNTRIDLKDAITEQSTSIDNGILYCKFLRKKNTFVQGRDFDLVNDKYNLLIAAGSSLKDNGVGFHDLEYLASGQARSLSDVGRIIGASDLLIRLHGALMIASWIGTASVGILLARYYKQTWLSTQFCGKDQWFAWHRFFMVLTWAMTIAAFVIIYVEIRDWSNETYHASFGLATTILAFIQPFMAALRPHPGTPRRPLFNWSHWFVGNAAHICAIIALFFSVEVSKARLPKWVDWILVAYVVFHVLTHVILSFINCAADKQDNHSINAFPMKDMHIRSSGHPDIRLNAPLAGLRKFLFGIYCFIILLFIIALIIIVVLAPIEESWNKLMEKISQN